MVFFCLALKSMKLLLDQGQIPRDLNWVFGSFLLTWVVAIDLEAFFEFTWMSFNQNRFKGTKKEKKIGTTVSRFLSELSFRKKNRSGEKKSSVQNIRSLFRGGMFLKNPVDSWKTKKMTYRKKIGIFKKQGRTESRAALVLFSTRQMLNKTKQVLEKAGSSDNRKGNESSQYSHRTLAALSNTEPVCRNLAPCITQLRRLAS